MDTADEEGPATPRRSFLEWARRRFLWLVVIVFALGFVVYEYSRVFFAYTSDAYVTTDFVTVAPLVSGQLADLRIRENERVEKGQVLFVLDLEPFQYEVDLHQAELELAEQRGEQAADTVGEAQDEFQATQAALTDAQKTQRRIQELVDQGVATQQRLDDTTRTLNIAIAQHNRSRTAISAAQERVQEATALVESARASLSLAQYRLGKATVLAPESGHVAPFDARVGDYLAVGQPTLAIVTDDDWRIVANLPEQHLGFLKEGQRTLFMMSSRPWAIYEGKVKSFSRGISRSQEPTQALPYVTPTTEWIRLSRRFPVEIDLEGLEDRLDLFMGSDARILILH